jgi:EpsI family protein
MHVRIAVAAALVLIALAASVWMRPHERNLAPISTLEAAIPERFGDWRVDSTIIPIPPSPDVQARLDAIYDQIVARTYVNLHGERVMLLVAYRVEQDDSARPHHQEVCYRAQGFSIMDLRHEVVSMFGRSVPVVRVHATRLGRSEPVTYWTTMGERIVWDRGQRMLAQVHYGLKGESVDGLLIRVSSLQSEAEDGYRLHGVFLNDLLRELPPALTSRFVGSGAAERRASGRAIGEGT